MVKKTDTADLKNKAQALLKVNQSSKEATFFKNQVVSGKEKIDYNEIKEVSFYSIKESINGLRSSYYAYFNIFTDDNELKLKFNLAAFFGENKENKETWLKVIEIYDEYIKPIMLYKFVKEIFDNNQSINIGGVAFDSRGYHKSKLFGGINSALWNETIYLPIFNDGNVILFKQKNETSAHFATISMEKPNAVIIPDLISICSTIYRNNR